MHTIEDLVGKFETEDIFQYKTRPPIACDEGDEKFHVMCFQRDDTVELIRAHLAHYLTKVGIDISQAQDKYVICFPHGPVKVELRKIDYYDKRGDSIVINISYNPGRNSNEEINTLKGEIIALVEKCVLSER